MWSNPRLLNLTANALFVLSGVLAVHNTQSLNAALGFFDAFRR